MALKIIVPYCEKFVMVSSLLMKKQIIVTWPLIVFVYVAIIMMTLLCALSVTVKVSMSIWIVSLVMICGAISLL